jgi:hypothetical protein
MHPSENFESRLAAYAMAAGAAGVTLLAASPPANAEVVFTPAQITFNSGVVYIDLNHDGVNDFALSIYNFDRGDRRLAASGLKRNGVLCYTVSYPPIAAPLGYRIGPGEFFANLGGPAVNVADTFGTSVSGPFANVGLRFFGLAFKINGEVHLGWAGVVAKARGHRGATPRIEVTLLGYAYETEAGKSIIAGDTGSGTNARMSDPIDDPGTLGMLAFGWRGQSAKRPDQP